MATTLRVTREPTTLDEALYSASCLAGAVAESCVTIRCAVRGRKEFYQILDGRVGDDGEWEAVYVLERA